MNKEGSAHMNPYITTALDNGKERVNIGKRSRFHKRCSSGGITDQCVRKKP